MTTSPSAGSGQADKLDSHIVRILRDKYADAAHWVDVARANVEEAEDRLSEEQGGLALAIRRQQQIADKLTELGLQP